MQPLLNIALNAARQAGEIIVRHLELLDRVKVSSKAGDEYFSEVDIKAEQAIIKALLKAHPEYGIIAEESGMYNAEADAVWIIDPLDGTTNFLHGFPFYAVSIALKVKDYIEHAVVLDPLRHEYFTASRGRGAFLNNRRIRVSKETKLSDSLLSSNFPIRNLNRAKQHLPIIEALIGQCRGVRHTGSAALDMAYTACGRVDGFWQLGLKPWDIAAASLIIKEAGGLIGDIQGGENYLKEGNVIAGSPKIFKALLQTIKPIAEISA